MLRSEQGLLSPEERHELTELHRILFQKPLTKTLLDVNDVIAEFDVYYKKYERDKEIARAFIISKGLEREYWMFYGRIKRRLEKVKSKKREDE